MSWISKNYEKVALGGAVVIGLGLAFVGWQKLSSVDEEFVSQPLGSGNNDPSVVEADAVSTAKSSFRLERSWAKAEDNGRPVDLFTGVPLFVNKNNLGNPVDLIEGEMVHPPIPNQWWIDNRIDPGFGDSPQRDADDDGFSNLAEFNAGTDPNENRSYPPLIAKLTYAGDESVQWVLKPGYASEDGAQSFTYDDTEGNYMKTKAANPIPPGGTFFPEEPILNRFKFVGSEKRVEMNERTNSETEVTYISVEDLKPNKKGQVYQIPAGFRDAEAKKHAKFDRTAVLTLEALGLDGQEMKVEENTAFALPPTNEEKNFFLKSVTPESITVEVTESDGTKQTYEIPKGATGPAS